MTKWLGEQLVEYEARASGLRAVTLRPCMVYDENETVGEHRSAMIRFVSNLARGRPIEVHRGSARSWLHVSDIVRGIEAAAHVDRYAVINLGHPELVPMADFGGDDPRRAERLTGAGDHDGAAAQMTLIKRPTLERQRSLLGFEPRVAVAEGVRRMCAIHARRAQRDTGPGDEAPITGAVTRGQPWSEASNERRTGRGRRVRFRTRGAAAPAHCVPPL